MEENESDTSKLLKDDSHNGYGTVLEISNDPESNKCEKKRQKAEKKSRSQFLLLIKFATPRDVTMMIFGSLLAILSGALLPILGLFFGSMTNAFISQSTYGLIPDELAHTSNNNSNSILISSFHSTSEITFERNDEIIDRVQQSVEKLFTSNELFPSLVTNGSTVVPITASQFHSILNQYLIIYLIIGTLMLSSCLLETLCWELASEHMVFQIRKLYLSRILRQDISWYDQNDKKNLSNKLADDVERIREGTGYKCAHIIQYVSTFVTGIGVGLAVNYRLTLIILCVIPILIYLTGLIFKFASSSTVREQESYGAAGYVVEEALSNIKTVNSFGGQVVEMKKYSSWLEEGRKSSMKKYILLASIVGLMNFIMYGIYALGFAVGSYLIRVGISDAGSVFTVFFSVIVGSVTIGQCLPHWSVVSGAMGILSSISDIVERKVVIDPYSKEGRKASKIVGNIEFKNTSFAYPSRPEIRVLDGFNLKIEPGKQIAIVGSSGAGKSTIISLILRYYDPIAGEVYIDDVPVQDYNVRWLRQQIGLVSQEPVLFGVSIAENIKYGADDVTHSQIIEAAKKANAHDFILSLPEGYETLVGDTGSQLSGGQKQRIAIARALVRDPKILLLDEATSALDALSEGIVQDALENVMKGRTTIIVAHRLSTIRNADMICVMQKGKFVESGTHTELMKKKSHYFDLIEAQMSREKSSSTDSESKETLDDDPKNRTLEEMITFEDDDYLSKEVHNVRVIDFDERTGFDSSIIKSTSEILKSFDTSTWQRFDEEDIESQEKVMNRQKSTEVIHDENNDYGTKIVPFIETEVRIETKGMLDSEEIDGTLTENFSFIKGSITLEDNEGIRFGQQRGDLKNRTREEMITLKGEVCLPKEAHNVRVIDCDERTGFDSSIIKSTSEILKSSDTSTLQSLHEEDIESLGKIMNQQKSTEVIHDENNEYKTKIVPFIETELHIGTRGTLDIEEKVGTLTENLPSIKGSITLEDNEGFRFGLQGGDLKNRTREEMITLKGEVCLPKEVHNMTVIDIDERTGFDSSIIKSSSEIPKSLFTSTLQSLQGEDIESQEKVMNRQKSTEVIHDENSVSTKEYKTKIVPFIETELYIGTRGALDIEEKVGTLIENFSSIKGSITPEDNVGIRFGQQGGNLKNRTLEEMITFEGEVCLPKEVHDVTVIDCVEKTGFDSSIIKSSSEIPKSLFTSTLQSLHGEDIGSQGKVMNRQKSTEVIHDENSFSTKEYKTKIVPFIETELHIGTRGTLDIEENVGTLIENLPSIKGSITLEDNEGFRFGLQGGDRKNRTLDEMITFKGEVCLPKEVHNVRVIDIDERTGFDSSIIKSSSEIPKSLFTSTLQSLHGEDIESQGKVMNRQKSTEVIHDENNEYKTKIVPFIETELHIGTRGALDIEEKVGTVIENLSSIKGSITLEDNQGIRFGMQGGDLKNRTREEMITLKSEVCLPKEVHNVTVIDYDEKTGFDSSIIKSSSEIPKSLFTSTLQSLHGEDIGSQGKVMNRQKSTEVIHDENCFSTKEYKTKIVPFIETELHIGTRGTLDIEENVGTLIENLPSIKGSITLEDNEGIRFGQQGGDLKNRTLDEMITFEDKVGLSREDHNLTVVDIDERTGFDSSIIRSSSEILQSFDTSTLQSLHEEDIESLGKIMNQQKSTEVIHDENNEYKTKIVQFIETELHTGTRGTLDSEEKNGSLTENFSSIQGSSTLEDNKEICFRQQRGDLKEDKVCLSKEVHNVTVIDFDERTASADHLAIESSSEIPKSLDTSTWESFHEEDTESHGRIMDRQKSSELVRDKNSVGTKCEYKTKIVQFIETDEILHSEEKDGTFTENFSSIQGTSFLEDDKEIRLRQQGGESSKTKSQKDQECSSEVMEREMTLREMIEIHLPEWPWLLISMVGFLGCGLINPLFALCYGAIFEVFKLTGEALENATTFWTYIFVLFAIFCSIVFFIEIYCMAYASEKVLTRTRGLVFENILRQPVGWFDLDSSAPGVLVNSLARNASVLRTAMGWRFGQVLSSGINIAAAMTIAFVCGWKLALSLIFIVPIIIWLLVKQQRISKRNIRRDVKLMDNAGRIASETVRNVRTVQALGREQLFTEMYARDLEAPYKEGIKQAVLYSALYGFSQGITFYMYAIAFRIGGYLIEAEEMHSEDMYRVFFALSLCASSVGTTFSYLRDYNSARQSVRLLNYLLKRESEIDSGSASGARPDISGAVEFNNVSFVYPNRPSVKVLRGLSLSVEAGKTLALVGESGCGKSTVISLLERFYDPESGTILVDGFDIRTLNLGHLRSKIGIVTQEPILFNTSIRNNIEYGAVALQQTVPLDQIIRAARLANIHDFIMSLPDRYDTLVGERGVQLSGGQKQRVAIARALIRDPKILLLDEATSALDTESEKIVQAALDEAKIGRTCIVVAHRLSTIQNADVICVVDEGKIVEQGTHEELEALKGHYFQLTQRQTL